MKAARFEIETMVCLTAEQAARLQIAAECVGMRPSQYLRQAGVEKMIQQGFMEHPIAKYNAANVANVKS